MYIYIYMKIILRKKLERLSEELFLNFSDFGISSNH